MTEKYVFLFPGQGAQTVGMGKDLYEQSDEAKEIFERADQLLGYSISRICFEGPEQDLTRTCYAQPAIYVTSYAALRFFNSKYPAITPSLVAGLSLGEFSALTAAECINFESGLRLVQQRAEAMEKAAQNNPGSMASIMGLNRTQCEEIAKEAGCQVANLNSPDQIALSGTVASIEKACQLAETKGAKRALPLKVGGAFHSSLMKEAETALETALKNTAIKTPKCTFIPNVLAEPVSDPEVIRTLLAKQLTSSVRWSDTMNFIEKQGYKKALEVGPGKVLKGLAKKSSPSVAVDPAGTIADILKLETILAGNTIC